MFSFPNKERKLAWIRSVVTPGFSSQSNPATGIPLYHAGIKQGTSGSSDPLMGSADNVYSGGANTRRFSRENIDPEISVVSLEDPEPIPSTSRGINWVSSESLVVAPAVTQPGERGVTSTRSNSTQSLNLIQFTGDPTNSRVYGKVGVPIVVGGAGLPSVNTGVVLGGIIAGNLALLDGEQGVSTAEGGSGKRRKLTKRGKRKRKSSERESSEEGLRERQIVRQSSGLEVRPTSNTSAVVEQSGHLVIDMTAIEDVGESEGPSVYLKTYYNMMYYCGVCRYRPMEPTTRPTNMIVCMRILLKALFIFLAMLSMLESVCGVKHAFLKAVSAGGYTPFSEFGFSITFLSAKVYGIYLFAFKKKQTEAMLAAMEEYEKTWHTKSGSGVSSWKKKLVIALALSTVASGGARMLFGTGNFEYLIPDASHELSEDIFIWHAKNMSEISLKLEAQYRSSSTVTNIAFAIVVLVRDLANFIEVGMIYDVIVLVGVVLMSYVKAFMKEVKQVTENVPVENVEEWNNLQARREKVWKQFLSLKKANDAINEVFDPLLKLLHGGNLLMYAYFMALVVFWEYPMLALALYAINMVKAEISYFIAGQIAEQNDAIRAWICNWGLHTGTITVDGIVMHVTVVLTQLDRNPLGLGKGKFLIHQTFHYKLVGLVGTVFFSMADEEKQN